MIRHNTLTVLRMPFNYTQVIHAGHYDNGSLGQSVSGWLG